MSVEQTDGPRLVLSGRSEIETVSGEPLRIELLLVNHGSAGAGLEIEIWGDAVADELLQLERAQLTGSHRSAPSEWMADEDHGMGKTAHNVLGDLPLEREFDEEGLLLRARFPTLHLAPRGQSIDGEPDPAQISVTVFGVGLRQGAGQCEICASPLDGDDDAAALFAWSVSVDPGVWI